MAAILGVLAKAFAFMGIIALGYTLKKIHVFKSEDFYVLSKIVIRITLPCAIISNFSKISMDMSMLILCVIGIVCNLIYVGIGYGINQKRSGDAKAFDMLNLSGYNIGNFTMPFIQNFLGPVGFAATSLFDAGNSVMCTGLTFALASAAKGEGGRSSAGSMAKTLLSSLPFDCYMIMTVVAMFQIKLPEVVLSFASTAGGANAFLALFMIGIGFEFLRGAPDSCHCGIWTGFFGQPGIYRQIKWGCGAFQCDQFFADYDQRGAAYPCTDCGAVGKEIRRLKYNGNLMLVITNNHIITMKNRRYDTMIYRK